MIRRDLLARLGDRDLLRGLAARVAADRAHTAEILAYIAEVDSRKLYLGEAFPSMHAYCVGQLRYSDDAAAKRIHAARAARVYPVLLDAISDGRLHLTAVCLLAPYLTRDNVAELLSAATHKRKWEIEILLAERFPRPDVPTWVRPVAMVPGLPVPGALSAGLFAPSIHPTQSPDVMTSSAQHAPAHVSLSHAEQTAAQPLVSASSEPSSAHMPTAVAAALTSPIGLPAPAPPAPALASPFGTASPIPLQATFQSAAPPFALMNNAPLPRALVAPLSAHRFKLQVTIAQPTHDLLRRAQTLLGSRVPAGDVAQVLEKALTLLVRHLEKQKLGDTNRPRATSRRLKRDSRHIPSAVKRAVMERDGEQCTFVSESGRRCEARRDLEFDHVREFARGGEATVDGIRLRCRAHNQYTAETTFGEGFMHIKREQARAAAAHRRVDGSSVTQGSSTRARAPAGLASDPTGVVQRHDGAA
jgi:hypothetical protein